MTDEDEGDVTTIERPPGRERKPLQPSEPEQPNGWRCEGCNRRSMNRRDLCHPVPA